MHNTTPVQANYNINLTINNWSFNILSPINFIINTDNKISNTHIIGPYYSIIKSLTKYTIIESLLNKLFCYNEKLLCYNIKSGILYKIATTCILYNLTNNTWKFILDFRNEIDKIDKKSGSYYIESTDFINLTVIIFDFLITGYYSATLLGKLEN